jgi:prepilin-type N-terminal cleavage/methylation domain-containing protein
MNRPRLHPRGFTFTEIMFAVIILGIGFIMVAGMFPVAIQQTQMNQAEAAGAAIAQGAMQALARSAREASIRANPLLVITDALGNEHHPIAASVKPDRVMPLISFRENAGSLPIWLDVQRDMIMPGNNRYAWAALYRYHIGDAFCQVIVFACESASPNGWRTEDVVFDPWPGQALHIVDHEPAEPFDDTHSGTLWRPPPLYTLYPKRVYVSLVNGLPNGLPDRATFLSGAEAVGPGSFLVVGQGNFPTLILRLGNIAGGNTYDLVPGFDIPDDTAALLAGPLEGWVIGKPNVTGMPDSYYGVTQDIYVYSGFVPVRPWAPPQP